MIGVSMNFKIHHFSGDMMKPITLEVTFKKDFNYEKECRMNWSDIKRLPFV